MSLHALLALALLPLHLSVISQGGATPRPGITQPTSATRPASQPAADEAYVHRLTGVEFPPVLVGMRRVSIRHFDEERRDVSAGYNDLRRGLVVTLYVYPQGESAQRRFDQAVGDIRAEHPKWKHRGSVQILREEVIIGSGFAGRFDSQAPEPAYGVRVFSDVWVFPLVAVGADGERYVVKMRATYPR